MMSVCTRTFERTLDENQITFVRLDIRIVQVNFGKLCNQACHHCHVGAGPERTEIMGIETMDRILALLNQKKSIHTVDITGGAPELNPNFKAFILKCRTLGKNVILRCNLSALSEKGNKALPEFLKECQVRIIASLPCYTTDNVDGQRGTGVFDKSIRGLKKLNETGYGKDKRWVLDLVYNPSGPFLPPPQQLLENDYKRVLYKEFGIEFNQLYTITNMPINRFSKDLKHQGKLQDYMDLLVLYFNPGAAMNVMCRDLISVSWDGFLYDCDFNQALDLPLRCGRTSIWQIDDFSQAENQPISTGDHCYGCTAGAGSSCQGVIA